ncbi:hypothetical protein D3C71_1546450 [compost metagenome]
MSFTFEHSEVPLGIPRGTPEDPDYGMDWHQIRVRFPHEPKRIEEFRDFVADMKIWCYMTFGNRDFWDYWEMRDWLEFDDFLVDFWFIQKAHAVAFKLRFA